MATTKVTTDVIDMSGNAGGLTWVKGTTAQRTTTTIGDLREDTDTKRTQVYTDQTGTAEWRNLKEAAVTSSLDSEYLVVAGGGGAGSSSQGGGGGGAGGYLTNYAGTKITLQSATAYSITVGTGGAGLPNEGSGTAASGGNSILSGSGITTITASGGGGATNNRWSKRKRWLRSRGSRRHKCYCWFS